MRTCFHTDDVTCEKCSGSTGGYPPPKATIHGVWMPKEAHEALLAALATAERERDFYKEQFRAKAERNGQNVIERDNAKEQAGVWLNATADARLEIQQLRAENERLAKERDETVKRVSERRNWLMRDLIDKYRDTCSQLTARDATVLVYRRALDTITEFSTRLSSTATNGKSVQDIAHEALAESLSTELETILTDAIQTLEGALTYNPFVDKYKLMEWHKRYRPLIERLRPWLASGKGGAE